MNLFKSIFSGEISGDQKTDAPPQIHSDGGVPSPSSPRNAAASWNLTGLVQTLAAKSESVIQTYRRDLEEFKSGLIAETAAMRAAVRDLPDVGASAAHASLESVGQAIDDIGSSVWREIISHGGGGGGYFSDAESGGGGRKIGPRLSYTRFDASMRAIQSDVDTYREDPEEEEFVEWKLGFRIEEGEREKVLEENPVVEEIYRKLVPGATDDEMFWCRYFFRVNKLKQVEEARATIVKKAMSVEDEELTWDLDEDEDEEESEKKEEAELELDSSVLKMYESEKDGCLPRKEIDDVQFDDTSEKGEGSSGWVVERWREEKEGIHESGGEGRADEGEESLVGIGVGGLPSSVVEVEDETEWDEVEDVVTIPETATEGKKKDKRKGVGEEKKEEEEEEDLSWDIEEDDEDAKSV